MDGPRKLAAGLRPRASVVQSGGQRFVLTTCRCGTSVQLPAEGEINNLALLVADSICCDDCAESE